MIIRFREIVVTIVSLLIMVSLSSRAFAQTPFDIRLRASKDRVFVGEVFDLTLHIEYTGEEGMVNIPSPQFPDIEEFEKVGTISISQQTVRSENTLTRSRQSHVIYEFTRSYKALKPGEFEIPGVTITINDPAQPKGKLITKSKPVRIIVLDIAVEQEEVSPEEQPEEGLRDIKDPVPAPKWVLYLLGVGGASILLALALFLARVIKPAPIQIPERVQVRKIVNPYKRAMEKLRKLKPPGVGADDEQVTAFYIKVSDIVKEYLGSRHHVLGFEATTWEITSSMREVYDKVTDGAKLIESLERFLGEIDLGKYAKAFREEHFMESAITRAREFIELDNKTIEHVEEVEEED